MRAQISDANKFPNFATLLRRVKSGEITYRELSLISDVLPFLSQAGLERLETDFNVFLKAVRSKAPQTDVTW